MGLMKQAVVGLEMDSMEIRAVEMAGTPMNHIVKAVGSMPLPTDAIKDGRVQDPAALGILLNSMWHQFGIKSKTICLAISNQDIIVRFASFPKVTKDKMDKLVRFQAGEYIPIPIDEVELDYTILGDAEATNGEQVKVLLVAARKQMINGYLDAFRHARMNVLDIGISMLAKNQEQGSGSSEKPTCHVQLNNDTGNVLVTAAGKPRLARMFTYATGVQKTYKLMLEDYHRNQFHDPNEVQTRELLEPIVTEIRSSILYDQNQNPNSPIQKVIFSGNLVKLRSVIPFLEQQIAYPLEVVLPERSIRNDKRSEMFYATDFNVCCDMAIRGLEGK